MDPRAAFRFLTYINQYDLAERVLLESLEDLKPQVAALVNSEFAKMVKPRYDEQRCRILIPKSRLLFGVCDAWGVLKEGECQVRVTLDGDGSPVTLVGTSVIVTRNPCLHPGDMQKFSVVQKPELSHLVDCIVFSTKGRRPAADLMSGGDLDGDKCTPPHYTVLLKILFADPPISLCLLGPGHYPIYSLPGSRVPPRQGLDILQTRHGRRPSGLLRQVYQRFTWQGEESLSQLGRVCRSYEFPVPGAESPIFNMR